jgi:hypothetical protein
MVGLVTDLTHAVYPHQQIYGDYCPIQGYIECPPEKVFEYMANPLSLAEWTYSMRDFRKVNDEGLFVGAERLVDDTEIYFKVVANREALTVDYHCAWDQGDELWMIYLNRIVPAELVLKRPGSVVFWQNCRHPNYQQNPYPERSSPERAWVGQYWDFFYGGHTVELGNLKKILEHRHARGEPVTPRVRLQEAR